MFVSIISFLLLAHSFRPFPFGEELLDAEGNIRISAVDLLHQIGDYFKGRRQIQKTATTTVSPAILVQIGDYFKGKRDHGTTKSPPTTTTKAPLTTTTKAIPTTLSTSLEPPAAAATVSILHQIGDYFKGKRNKDLQ